MRKTPFSVEMVLVYNELFWMPGSVSFDVKSVSGHAQRPERASGPPREYGMACVCNSVQEGGPRMNCCSTTSYISQSHGDNNTQRGAEDMAAESGF